MLLDRICGAVLNHGGAVSARELKTCTTTIFNSREVSYACLVPFRPPNCVSFCFTQPCDVLAHDRCRAAVGGRPNIILCMADARMGRCGLIPLPSCFRLPFSNGCFVGASLRAVLRSSAGVSPTRGSVLTGRHPSRYVVFFFVGHTISPRRSRFRGVAGAGYRPGHFGKWHVCSVRGMIRSATHSGFDDRLIRNPPETSSRMTRLSRNGRYPELEAKGRQ